jgi:hypothetical protein
MEESNHEDGTGHCLQPVAGGNAVRSRPGAGSQHRPRRLQKLPLL